MRIIGWGLLLLASMTPQVMGQKTLTVVDTQDPRDVPLPPAEARRRIELPEGFQVTLFAGEPDVRQPIAFCIDDRGRLWVAECYAYRTWKPTGNDRILIFEDRDNDGQFDSRKVFWAEGHYLTGLQVGFGGVWICNAPYVQFIPDADADDVPDGPPRVMLDGWSTEGVHNVVNALTWGPDGWLYGCNGITSPSRVGTPATPAEQRVEINCGIWRFHPATHRFEVVAHGTTNPWGLDFDQYGQGFFTNCVIHHLWHLIPGAHYNRMFGQDLNTRTYRLMDSCADYLHWAGDDWTKARGGQEHDRLGGGHAHAGAMIYLADNWPQRYRNSLFTCNIHGNRVNNDLLQRSGSGYAAQRAPDFMFAHDPWFRGLELKYGPDGGVFVSDWTDLGECHDQDGVHRNSGRIYKVIYGNPTSLPVLNLAEETDEQLIDRHSHPNQWYVRHARRLLQERAVAGRLHEATAASLNQLLDAQAAVTSRLDALWTLHVIGQAPRETLRRLLSDSQPDIRLWAIRLLCENQQLAVAEVTRLAELAANDPSPRVRLELASTLQRLPVSHRWPIAQQLVLHAEDAKDQNLPLMIWYGIEPAVAADRQQAVKLLAQCTIPLVREFITRRIVEND